MYKISVKPKYAVGQEVYIIKSVTKKITSCSCGRQEYMYDLRAVKAKVKGLSVTSSITKKGTKSSFTYNLSTGYYMNEQTIFSNRKSAELECAKRRSKGTL